MLKNIRTGWKTTVLGIVISAASIASVFVKDVTWGDASIGIGLGLALLFAPDTILNKLKSEGKV